MGSETTPSGPGDMPAELVPRFERQGYSAEALAERRRWIEERTGARLDQVGSSSTSSESMRGNIENPIGTVQIPLGVAGPLRIDGEHAQGVFYVPFATTEGTLVRSYERGVVAITRAGGASARVVVDENRVSPVFLFEDVAEAAAFARGLPALFEAMKAEAETTTRHGRLLRVEPQPLGREVVVHFGYWTADAHGMNMIVKATDHVCRWLAEHGHASRYYIFSGAESEKRASGLLFAGGKGKKVIAGVRIPARIVRSYLHATPEQMADVCHRTMLGHVQANTTGHNAHIANGLTALFIACGQDVANVANSAVGVTSFDVLEGGDLYASVTLPSLIVATVGGGTDLGTARECLEMLGCVGAGKAPKLAEIAAGLVLGGELSMSAAIASGEFVQAHETYGRNRPAQDAG